MRNRLSGFCKRTLRNQVTEYIRYTERRPITRPFTPSDDEHALYEAVSGFLRREDSYALPQRQRHLTALILRKLLASSSLAVAATLDTLRRRLETLRDGKVSDDPEFIEGLIDSEEIEGDLLDEILAEPDEAGAEAETTPRTIDRQKLREEIDILQRLANWARGIGTDTKTRSLLAALDIGFAQMAKTGAARKALIFTESRRTQDYLKTFLESHGYGGQVVVFNGSNGGPEATAIYERWVEKNRDTGRDSGSRAVDVRTRMNDTRRTLFEHFDEDVHQRLLLQLDDAKAQLDRFGQRFWSLTRFMLATQARFDDAALAFDLECPPGAETATGRYHLISKSSPRAAQEGDDLGEERSRFLYRLSHPLGEHVVECAKSLDTPVTRIVFDVSQHPARIHAVETLRGKSGFLRLTRLVIESYEREEYLLFSGFNAAGGSLDQETMEKILGCAGRVEGDATIPPGEQQRLSAESERHAKATVSRSLEQNSRHFHAAREKLEKWSDDMVLSAEKALADTKEQIKALRRQARQAVTLEEQHGIQQQIQKLEKQQRRQRQDIFKTEDEVMEQRDSLVASLERRLARHTAVETLFTIRGAVT